MIEVIHNPYGQEHPYEQGPEERFPREPLAGQPFTIGIVTRPPDAVKQVLVCQKIDGLEQPSIEAALISDWQQRMEEGVGAEFLERLERVEQDVWQANLTAPNAGQTLEYWIEADQHADQRFILRGAAWRSGGGGWLDGLQMTLVHNGDGREEPPLPAPCAQLEEVEWLDDGQNIRRVRLTFACTPDERFFGLGERFNALDQRGNLLDVRVYEQYKNQGKRTYMPIPFLLSSRGYGVWVRSSRWMQFDLAASNPAQWVLEAELGADETLNLQWFTGDDPLDIIRQFVKATGTTTPVASPLYAMGRGSGGGVNTILPLPPAWAFGLWMSGNEWNTQARVEAEVKNSLQHGIYPTVMVIEAWSDETTFYIWNDAQYSPKSGDQMHQLGDFTFPSEGKWPDPKGMVDRLHAQNIKVLLWQVPAMKALEAPHPQHEADRVYFEAQKFGVREAGGWLYQVRPFWFRGGYLWDVTNPAASEWWLNKRAYLLDEIGIDGFKTDGGEHLWGTGTQFADGRTGAEVWNEYPQLYTEAYYQFANEKRGGEAITFSRAGFTGSGSSPLHWAGDENSTWDAFRHSILAGLSAGVSGIPFWGWDLGGFSGETPSAELYLRGTAMATFCPVMQYHSEFNQHRENRDRTPWNIAARTGDDRVIPFFRHFVNVRHNLLPYIWQEAQHSAQTGEPMMRALGLWHREAPPYQYFFGRDLLISPVVQANAQKWALYLPSGDWFDLWTDEHYTGGGMVEVAAPLDRIPVFVRGGTEIPVRLGETGALGEYVPFGVEATGMLRFG